MRPHPQEPRLFVDRDFQQVGFGEILQQHGGDVACELLADPHQRDFEVQPARAVVEVDRPDRGDVVIDQKHLLMHEAVAVLVDLHPGVADDVEMRKGRQPDRQMIGPTGDEDAHIHAAQGGQFQRRQDIGVRHEIG